MQGDIDELLRDCPQSPFRAANFTNARPEELQRMALVAATQLVLFEPKDWVEGNDRFAGLAEDLLDHVIKQVEWVKKNIVSLNGRSGLLPTKPLPILINRRFPFQQIRFC